MQMFIFIDDSRKQNNFRMVSYLVDYRWQSVVKKGIICEQQHMAFF